MLLVLLAIYLAFSGFFQIYGLRCIIVRASILRNSDSRVIGLRPDGGAAVFLGF